jgi:hypothetical protein
MNSGDNLMKFRDTRQNIRDTGFKLRDTKLKKGLKFRNLLQKLVNIYLVRKITLSSIHDYPIALTTPDF